MWQPELVWIALITSVSCLTGVMLGAVITHNIMNGRKPIRTPRIGGDVASVNEYEDPLESGDSYKKCFK